MFPRRTREVFRFFLILVNETAGQKLFFKDFGKFSLEKEK